MDIKGGKKGSNQSNPTPNNTPRANAPIQNKVFVQDADLAGIIEAKLAQKQSEDSLPESVKNRINALKYLQNQQAVEEHKMREEMLSLEAKYLSLFQPLYQQRALIVGGKTEPTDEEAERDGDSDLEEELAHLSLDEKGEKGGKGGKGEEKGVPGFWSMALRTHPQISEIVAEHDLDALLFLADLRLSCSQDNLAFTLEFEFAPNPYFTNSTLTKTYHLLNQVGSHVDTVHFERAEGCTINWKEGKNLTVRIETRKQKNRGSKKTRVVKREVPQDSFFRFFTPPQRGREKGEEEEEEEEEDEEEEGGEEDELYALEMDFEIGDIIKNKIIPHAVLWFTGKALENEPGYYNDDDEDDLFGEDGEEEEEEEEEEEVFVQPGKKGGRRY